MTNQTIPSISPLTPQQAIGLMIEIIVHDFHPVRVILFGSQARDEATNDSDIDLLVVFANVVDKNEQTVAIRRALRHIPFPKDIVVAAAEELTHKQHQWWSIYYDALQYGHVVYDTIADAPVPA